MAITAPTRFGRAPKRHWYYWLRHVLLRIELTPLRITLVYVVFGMGALYVSDVLFVHYLSEPLLSQVQAVKGGAEVLLTAGLIYVLTRRSRGQLQGATEQLERQRDELQLLHRVFRHNLRNDLNVIQGRAELAREELSGKPAEAECEQIIDTTEKVAQYTKQARRIRKVTEGDDQRRTIDLSDAIPRILAAHPQVTEAVEVTTEIPEGVEVLANPMFEEAFREVVTNAITHNDAASPAIAIDVAPAGGPSRMVEVRIRDNGPGIPESEIEPLRGDRVTQLLHSTGMGLWFVDWVVTHSGGDLAVLSPDAGGTAVHVQLPKALAFSRDLPAHSELTRPVAR